MPPMRWVVIECKQKIFETETEVNIKHVPNTIKIQLGLVQSGPHHHLIEN
jgi:hypothetical protein